MDTLRETMAKTHFICRCVENYLTTEDKGLREDYARHIADTIDCRVSQVVEALNAKWSASEILVFLLTLMNGGKPWE